jgi:heat-inducible transcriptional repressor
MNERQAELLTTIINEFIQTGLPVGSKTIIDCKQFNVSGATIRNEMHTLSEEGFLEQPHISAGRIPTALGYRTYVKEFMKPTKHEALVKEKFESLKNQYLKRKDQERAYEAVALLSRIMPNISFATIPHRNRVYYMGLANVLRQPEFQQDSALASNVVEVLEESLTDLLESVEIDNKIRYYIGEDHILQTLQSCALLVTKYTIRGEEDGVVGILGPIRMDYAYNTVALELAVDLLNKC